MRALADWYFTAHPPIMHDLHESLPLLYTYSGAAPQNPNLDPILFTELPFFSNFELAQMTKWGMPGVYTHAFMDGWSPGYLGSVAYNHNGMMRMYETQSGSERPPACGSRQCCGGCACGAGGCACGCCGATPAGASGRFAGGCSGGFACRCSARNGCGRADAGDGGCGGDAAGTGRVRGAATRTRRRAPATRRRRGSRQAPAARRQRGGAQAAAADRARRRRRSREWYRGIPIPPGAAPNFSRRNNTNYMQTGVLSGLQLTSMFPNLVRRELLPQDAELDRRRQERAPHGYVIPVQRDMTRVATLVNLLRVQRIEVGAGDGEIKISDGTFPAGSYVIKRDQPYGRLAKNLLERQNYPDPNLRTYDDSGWTMGLAMLVGREGDQDKAILDVPTTPVKEAVAKGKVQRQRQRRPRRSRTSARPT